MLKTQQTPLEVLSIYVSFLLNSFCEFLIIIVNVKFLVPLKMVNTKLPLKFYS